jgi:hypothetical protein
LRHIQFRDDLAERRSLNARVLRRLQAEREEDAKTPLVEARNRHTSRVHGAIAAPVSQLFRLSANCEVSSPALAFLLSAQNETRLRDCRSTS